MFQYPCGAANPRRPALVQLSVILAHFPIFYGAFLMHEFFHLHEFFHFVPFAH